MKSVHCGYRLLRGESPSTGRGGGQIDATDTKKKKERETAPALSPQGPATDAGPAYQPPVMSWTDWPDLYESTMLSAGPYQPPVMSCTDWPGL